MMATRSTVCSSFLKALLILLMCAALVDCGRAPERAYTSQLLALGTLVDITLWDVEPDAATDAVNAVEVALNEAHRRWHAWEPSDLTRLNEGLAAGRSVLIDADLRTVLEQATSLARASGQLFNPAVGRLIELWGFHSDDAPEGPPPAQSEIDRLLQQAPTMENLTFQGNRAVADNPRLQLDLGGFAKGLAVNRAIKVLRRHGIQHAIVNAGGDLRAIGQRGDRPWRIGIRHPVEPGIIASVETQGDDSVFTSGNYERYFDYQGRRYHHIIDPRTGYPANGTLSVTVIHDDAAVADAAATALFVAGPENWRDTAQRMGISKVMLIDEAMNVQMTDEMKGRITFEVDPPPEIVTVQAP